MLYDFTLLFYIGLFGATLFAFLILREIDIVEKYTEYINEFHYMRLTRRRNWNILRCNMCLDVMYPIKYFYNPYRNYCITHICRNCQGVNIR